MCKSIEGGSGGNCVTWDVCECVCVFVCVKLRLNSCV